MKKRYDELMDRIEVTDEMRKRILNNLQNGTMEQKTRSKILRFSMVKAYISIAACLVILLMSPLVLPKVFKAGGPEEPAVMGTWSVREVSSLAQLEEEVHFNIQEINNLPFVPEKKTYIAYGSDMAEILYEDGVHSACFRKSRGQEDNSGDYNEYAENQEISAGTVTVSLKGDSGIFTLAVWTDDEFSYSLNLSEGMTPAQWSALITAME